LCIEEIESLRVEEGNEKVPVGLKNKEVEDDKGGKTDDEKRGGNECNISFSARKKLIDIKK
jgi:hypothetical protein